MQSLPSDAQNIAINVIERKNPLEIHYFASITQGHLTSIKGADIEDNHTAAGRVPLKPHVKYKDFDIIFATCE